MSVSENSIRIARNTALLYGRMLLLMVIGLFTSRVVLNMLGIDDSGVYNAVGGVVTMFSVVTSSLAQAISRYITFELGRGDAAKLRRVFSTSVVLQLVFCAALLLFVETIGTWYLDRYMNMPEGRLDAAHWVLQCSMGVMMLSLLSIPFNATIIAHERMGAFAYISILEAVLKLAVALLLFVSPVDKLKTYAVLMLAVAVIVRVTYGVYCHRHFEESRGRLVFDRSLIREMMGFAGWNFLGSSAYVVNTAGVNLVVNYFFGVVLNAARQVTTQVEGIVKQFVTNFLTALNPQITKSWATGRKDYCFELVAKGAKYSYLVILMFFVPFFFEAEIILRLWLKIVPDYSALFVRLTLIGLLIDMFGNPLLTLMLATGDVRRYYLITGFTSYLCLPLVWLAFKMGASPAWCYIVFIIVYGVVLVQKLSLSRSVAGFPVARFLRGTVLPLLLVTLVSVALPAIVWALVPTGFWRLLLVTAVAWMAMAISTYAFALTQGERSFILRKVGRWLPDCIYVPWKYSVVFGRWPRTRRPRRFTEVLQWTKLHDRNPLYHTLVDKAAVKGYVASKVGEEHVIPTLGVWSSVEEIDWDALPDRFVLKCTHDSGSTIICRDKASFDRAAAIDRLSKAQSRDFYTQEREWAYKGLEPRIIAERYMSDDPVDYKFFCFHGVPRFMFVATDRGSETEEVKFDFFDMDYRHLDIRNGHDNAPVPPARPACFEQMKALAAELSAGIPQVRIDFYEIDGKVYFGEYTFCHFGGIVPFEPDEVDERLGSYFNE